ncbi:hypothetical protein [Bradyrhizobium sp. SZCCHNR3118]|uniref:hypothetical protein n=1 Tax=Bradyrhizobium sp. SZCCHNR3118 TaxID=3057468 RepID=UPI002915D74B|nr:hypothetical protein [Bradyrhizobium sp. SZCCHNR3118]
MRKQPLNARFQARLPGIIEDIAQQMLVIEPAMEKVAIPIREFIDFLDFEIEKMQLSIEQQRWQSTVDVKSIAADEAWLKQLTDLRKDLDIYDLTVSVPRIDILIANINKTFTVEGGG